MGQGIQYGSAPCRCEHSFHATRLIALTGGPGGGKTAALELAVRSFCEHVAILPEAASVVFGGGFPRHETDPGRAAAQRAIYHVQREMERLVVEERRVAVALCDRGTIDGLAYWPGDTSELLRELGTSHEGELTRYDAVLHLRTPAATQGYDHSNALRVESAVEAIALDRRIDELWAAHDNREVVEASDDFLTKMRRALEVVRSRLPSCCHVHPLAVSS